MELLKVANIFSKKHIKMKGQMSFSNSLKPSSHAPLQCCRKGHTNIQKSFHFNPCQHQHKILNVSETVATGKNDTKHVMSNKYLAIRVGTCIHT